MIVEIKSHVIYQYKLVVLNLSDIQYNRSVYCVKNAFKLYGCCA